MDDDIDDFDIDVDAIAAEYKANRAAPSTPLTLTPRASTSTTCPSSFLLFDLPNELRRFFAILIFWAVFSWRLMLSSVSSTVRRPLSRPLLILLPDPQTTANSNARSGLSVVPLHVANPPSSRPTSAPLASVQPAAGYSTSPVAGCRHSMF